MARARKSKKRILNPWTATDLRTLRKQAGRTPVKKLARELKRTEGALRQKASSLGVSLRPR